MRSNYDSLKRQVTFPASMDNLTSLGMMLTSPREGQPSLAVRLSLSVSQDKILAVQLLHTVQNRTLYSLTKEMGT